MFRRAIRMAGVCLGVLATLGLAGCDTGPVVLEGTLTHAETGVPVANVPVRVYSSTEETVVARTHTGEDGSYRVRAGLLAAGTYRVRFSVDRWWEDGDSWSTATDVGVSAGRPARLDAALVPAMAAVWGPTVSDGPSPDVRVDVFHADTGELVATAFSFDGTGTPRGCLGCYELELPAGNVYTFRATSPPGFGWTTNWFWRSGGPAGGFGVELVPGEQEVGLFLFREAAFSGRVVDAAGSPFAGARVLGVPSREPVPPKLDEVTTGADGTFLAGGLKPGSYYKFLVLGPGGTWTFAGMINGDPATATEFYANGPTLGAPIEVGDITLDGP